MRRDKLSVESNIEKALLACRPGRAVLTALHNLFTHDAYLLEVDANERSISHRFAMHLQAALPDYHVDCEYNRDGIEPKRLGPLDLRPDPEDTEARTVFPDVIVHKRGTKNNFLVIEMKKSKSTVPRDTDLAKLSGYKRELGYKFALFLEITVGEKIGVSTIEWVDA